MDTLTFVILALATWRICSLLVNEAGPFALFDRFRLIIGVRYDERGQPYGRNVFAQLFTCIWCASVWIGALIAGAYYFFPRQTTYTAMVFAMSAGAIMVSSITAGAENG